MQENGAGPELQAMERSQEPLAKVTSINLIALQMHAFQACHAHHPNTGHLYVDAINATGRHTMDGPLFISNE